MKCKQNVEKTHCRATPPPKGLEKEDVIGELGELLSKGSTADMFLTNYGHILSFSLYLQLFIGWGQGEAWEGSGASF